MGWPSGEAQAAAGPLVASLFTAVVVGVLDEAIHTAKQQLAPKADGFAPTSGWSGGAELKHGSRCRRTRSPGRESGDQASALHATLRAKEAVAELAETSLGRFGRVIGGGTYSRRSPFAAWFEDVRALGFLRPPWGLAYDALFGTSFS